MKTWLSVLLENLPQSPVLTLSSSSHVARFAIYDREGRLLAGDLGSDLLSAQAVEEAGKISPGECRLLSQQGQQLSFECLSSNDETKFFWQTALDNQNGAWASWLLTIPVLGQGELKFTRHVLSAFGPWTPLRLPEDLKAYWALLPLKPGLGRLIVAGDDELALELAALGGRIGLTSSLISIKNNIEKISNFRALGDFDFCHINSWADLSNESLDFFGFKEGIHLVLTQGPEKALVDTLRKISPAYFAHIEEGEYKNISQLKPYAFSPPAATNSQKALALLTEMLA